MSETTAPAPKLQADVPADHSISPAAKELAAYTSQVQGSTVAELRKLARKVGLKPTGKKAELVAALVESRGRMLDLAIEAPAPATAPKPAPAAAAPKAKAKKAAPKAASRKALGSTDNAPAKFCRCGCGEQVTRLFRQGHDARHAGNLVRKWEAGELTRSKAIAAAQRISDALGRKVIRGIEIREEKAAKKAAAAKAAKAAKK